MEITNSISFGSHHSVLKTLWKKGLLPTVKKGFYGEVLTSGNISLEHLALFSATGNNRLSNLVLSSEETNHARGSSPLWKIINIIAAKDYLTQFKGVHVVGKFDGDNYVNMITKTLKNIGIDLEKGIIKKRFKNQTKMRRRCRCCWRG